jgi:hypothetical protein
VDRELGSPLSSQTAAAIAATERQEKVGWTRRLDLLQIIITYYYLSMERQSIDDYLVNNMYIVLCTSEEMSYFSFARLTQSGDSTLICEYPPSLAIPIVIAGIEKSNSANS